MVTGFKQGKYEKALVSGIYNGLSRTLFHVPVRDLNSVKAYRREWHSGLSTTADMQDASQADQFDGPLVTSNRAAKPRP